MTVIDGRIPRSMLAHLDQVPPGKPVAVLLRHSVRDELPPNEAGNAVALNDIGRRLAFQFGERLRGRLRRLHTSPVLRCVQTAELLNAGAGTNLEIVADRLLGDPGVYVVDAQLAWSNWERLGHEGVIEHLVSVSDPLPGMAQPDEAARFLVRHMLAIAANETGLHVFVSHDSLVAATAARTLGKRLSKSDWPWFLEGAFFQQTDGGVHVVYQGYEHVLDGD